MNSGKPKAKAMAILS